MKGAADSARKSKTPKDDARLSRKLGRAGTFRSSSAAQPVDERRSVNTDSRRGTKNDASGVSSRRTTQETVRRTKVDAAFLSSLNLEALKQQSVMQRRVATMESMEAGVLKSRKLWQTMESSLKETHASAPRVGKAKALETKMLRGLWSEAREQYSKRKLEDEDGQEKEFMDGKQLLGTAISTVFSSVHKALRKKNAVHVFQEEAAKSQERLSMVKQLEEGGDTSEEDDSDAEEEEEIKGQMDEIDAVQHELEELVETKGWGEQMIDSFKHAAVSLNAMTMRLACLKRSAQKSQQHRKNLEFHMEHSKNRADQALAKFWQPVAQLAESQEPDAPVDEEKPMPTFEPMPTAEIHERHLWQPKQPRKTKRYHDISQLQKAAALSAGATSDHPVQPVEPKARKIGNRFKLIVALSNGGGREQSLASIKQKLLAAADLKIWIFLFRKRDPRKVDSLLVPQQFQALIREGSQLPRRLLSYKDLQKLFHHINSQKTEFISYRHDFLPWLLCEDGDNDAFALLQEINRYLDSAPKIGTKGLTASGQPIQSTKPEIQSSELDKSAANDCRSQTRCNDDLASQGEINKHLDSALQEDTEASQRGTSIAPLNQSSETGIWTANDCRTAHEDGGKVVTTLEGETDKYMDNGTNPDPECLTSTYQRRATTGPWYSRRELDLSTANDCRPNSAPALLGMSSQVGPRPAMPLTLASMLTKWTKKSLRQRRRSSLQPSLRSSMSEKRQRKSVRFLEAEEADAVAARSSLPGHSTAMALGDFRMVPTYWWTNHYAQFPCCSRAPSLAEQPKPEVEMRHRRAIIDPHVDLVEYPVEAEVLEYEPSDDSSSDDMQAEESESMDHEDADSKEESAEIEFGEDSATEEYMLRDLDDLNENEEDDNLGDVNENESVEELKKRITVCTNQIHEFVDKFHNLFKIATRNSTEADTSVLKRSSRSSILQDESVLLNVEQAICDVAFSLVSSPPQVENSKRRSITQRLSLSRVALAGWEVMPSLKEKNEISESESESEEEEEKLEEEEDWYTASRKQQKRPIGTLQVAASLDDEAAAKAVSSILSSFVLAPQEVPSVCWTAKVDVQQPRTSKSGDPSQVHQDSNLPTAASSLLMRAENVARTHTKSSTMPVNASACSKSPRTDLQAAGLLETVVKQRTKRFSRLDPISLRGDPCDFGTKEAEPPQLFVPVAPATPPLREARPFKLKHRWQRSGGTLDEDARPIIDVLPSDFSLPPSPTPLPPIDVTDGKLPFRRRRHKMVTVADDPPFSKTRRQNLSLRLPRSHDHV